MKYVGIRFDLIQKYFKIILIQRARKQRKNKNQQIKQMAAGLGDLQILSKFERQTVAYQQCYAKQKQMRSTEENTDSRSYIQKLVVES